MENAHVAVAIDERTGSVSSIRDKRSGAVYPQTGIGFSLTTDRGSIRSREASRIERTAETIALLFDEGDFAVQLHYRLGPQDLFVEKWLQISATDKGEYVIQEVALEDVTLDAQMREIHVHDDQTKWHCPINLFLRSEAGGCFAGLEYPYWKLELRDNTGFRIGYAPSYASAKGETFISERYFLGVYRYEEIYRYSHGPFPGPLKPGLVTFEGSSVSHYPDTSDVRPEVLDWGEVWAMQTFTRSFLPDNPLPDDGYYMWVNSWWAWAYDQSWSLKHEDIDLLARVGIRDVMTQSIWFGRGQHPNDAPYLVKMDPDAPAAFEADAEVESLVAYGRSQGVNITSFCLPGVHFDSKPDWRSVKADGTPHTYCGFGSFNCFANREHARFMLELYDYVLTKYQCRYWGFDGRWMSYREVPYPDGGAVGPDPCYALNHGHPPGDNFYLEWKNINSMLAELRRRHPTICLETYYGTKPGGPWVRRSLNATENYYEVASSDQNRFQQWHNQNGRFLPPGHNYSAVFGRDSAGFRFSLIACLAGGPYCQIGAGLHQLRDEGNQRFLVRWRVWASHNHRYLRIKRDLFPAPGYARVDGSAHVVEDRGFLFLFPTGLQPNSHTTQDDEGIAAKVRDYEKAVRASIKLNRWLGLEENPQAVFTIREVYPVEGRPLGTYNYGDTFLYDMPRDSAVIVSLEPEEGGAAPFRAGFDPSLTAVHVVEAFRVGVMDTATFLASCPQERVARLLQCEAYETAGGK